jgi:peroxiredoxin
MRIKPILFFGVIALIAGYLIYRQADPNEIKVGKLAPDVTVKDQSGKQMKLSDLRGNLVFLNVWWTDCAPCVQEMPEMELMNHAFRDRKFKMVTVSIDTDWKPVTAFMEKYRLTMPVYLDPGRTVYNAFHLTGTPETFLIDRNGIILKHTIGADRWASDAVMAKMDKLIKEQETPLTASE